MSLFLLSGCYTLDRQSGGSMKVNANHGNATVQQAENAKENAILDYKEDGVVIPANAGDELNVEIVTQTNGSTKKVITYKPTSKSEVRVSSVDTNANTGSSYEDMVGQLQVFMQNSKIILWVGLGFIAGGGIFVGMFRDVKSGAILAGIGAVMLVGYAILPQIYANYMIVVAIGAISIPILWYLHYSKTKRIAQASIKAHEELKRKDPVLAKEHSKHFKEHIKPNDLHHAKKLK